MCIAELSVPLSSQEREIIQYSSPFVSQYAPFVSQYTSHLYRNTLRKILVVVITRIFPITNAVKVHPLAVENQLFNSAS